MQEKSEAEFIVGIWPLKISVKGIEAIRKLNKALNVLILSLAIATIALMLRLTWLAMSASP